MLDVPPAPPFSAFQLFSISLLCLLYAPTRFLHEANPIWRLTSLLWTLEVIGLTLLTVQLVLSASAHRVAGCGLRISDFIFPICFFLVAVPWPSGLENRLVQSLMRANVETTVELLGLLGISAVPHGNVIEVGSGVVGIDEACSGIRSLQATLMISLFLGELYRLTVHRRVWLVVLGFVLAFVFNVGRTLLLTGIASANGVGAVASWHDPAGVTILVACFLGLWVLAVLLRGQRLEVRSQKPEAQPPSALSPQLPTLRKLAFALGAWLLLVEGGTEFWFRLHERGASGIAKWSVRWPDNQAGFKAVEVPAGIRGQFRYDEGIEGRWQDANGGEWQLYYFRWLPARSLNKRVAIQLAKTHGPEKCLPAVGMQLKSDLGIKRFPVGDLELAVHQYVFEADGRFLHVFYGIYEDQGGAGDLVNRRLTPSSRIRAALSGSRNFGQRFLEVAVSGYETPEDARAAFAREMATRIKVGV
jgi:exosortase